MKIKLPKFEPFNKDWFDKDNMITRKHQINDIYWYCVIELETMNPDKDYLYGYISEDYHYGSAIVKTDDILIERTKDGKLKRTDIKKAYNTCVKQLRDRYKKWVLDNIMETNVVKDE